jgi:cell wall assembly regulator SMI1
MNPQYQRFIDTWTYPDYRPGPTLLAALDAVEQQLATVLPRSLRDFLAAYGPVSAPGLLGAVVEQDLEIEDLSEFLGPDDMVELTQGWRGQGLAAHLVAFATDSSGNLFCFEEASERADDAQVWFFDHDFQTNESLGLTFAQWLDRYADLTPADLPGR